MRSSEPKSTRPVAPSQPPNTPPSPAATRAATAATATRAPQPGPFCCGAVASGGWWPTHGAGWPAYPASAVALVIGSQPSPAGGGCAGRAGGVCRVAGRARSGTRSADSPPGLVGSAPGCCVGAGRPASRWVRRPRPGRCRSGRPGRAGPPRGSPGCARGRPAGCSHRWRARAAPTGPRRTRRTSAGAAASTDSPGDGVAGWPGSADAGWSGPAGSRSSLMGSIVPNDRGSCPRRVRQCVAGRGAAEARER